jgi:hypothetical protein
VTGNTENVPPPEYWKELEREFAGLQLDWVHQRSDDRVTELTADAAPPPQSAAQKLLDRIASDGWFEKVTRRTCPNCDSPLTDQQAAEPMCPFCGQPFSDHHGGVTIQVVYVRHLEASRSVDWVVAVHGMNTRGAWQEAFSWLLATTWGRSVPVAVYKYGIVIAGVVMPWRRRTLQRQLRQKIATLRDQAIAHGFSGKPDVIAHSFGTWLIGHILEDELQRTQPEQLRFGRVILTGCVLRPDFDWNCLEQAGLVEAVMNHYGTADPVVPLAHPIIFDSGPSGRRGFDSGGVLNIRAAGLGHSDLFKKRLDSSYSDYWKPFLTLPAEELGQHIPDRVDPTKRWRELPWPLRGTLFPIPALLFIAAVIALLVTVAGRGLWAIWVVPVAAAAFGVAGLLLLGIATAGVLLWRKLRLAS